MLLGVWGSLSAVAVYLMLGAMGLPVFSGGMAGLGVLLGPTGGYIWSYLPICLLCGWLYRTLFFSRPNKERGFFKLFWGIVCGLPGLLLCYLLGTLQYMLVASISFWSALAVCVIPFVGFDLLKLALVAFLGEKMLRIRWIRRMLGDCFG